MAHIATVMVAGGAGIFALAALGVSSGTISAVPLANAEVLEESVANEVEHAIDRGMAALAAKPAVQPTNDTALVSAWLKNGNATEQAIRLVSSQGVDGRWMIGTNDVTRAAIRHLRFLVGNSGGESCLR